MNSQQCPRNCWFKLLKNKSCSCVWKEAQLLLEGRDMSLFAKCQITDMFLEKQDLLSGLRDKRERWKTSRFWWKLCSFKWEKRRASSLSHSQTHFPFQGKNDGCAKVRKNVTKGKVQQRNFLRLNDRIFPRAWHTHDKRWIPEEFLLLLWDVQDSCSSCGIHLPNTPTACFPWNISWSWHLYLLDVLLAVVLFVTHWRVQHRPFWIQKLNLVRLDTSKFTNRFSLSCAPPPCSEQALITQSCFCSHFSAKIWLQLRSHRRNSPCSLCLQTLNFCWLNIVFRWWISICVPLMFLHIKHVLGIEMIR